MRRLLTLLLVTGVSISQPPNAEAGRIAAGRGEGDDPPKGALRADGPTPKRLWIVPGGTRIPIQLRQPVSTKTAAAGDPIYAQTSYPIAIDGDIVIPAGTWAHGIIDDVKRAGRIKGTAALNFHLDTLLYPNGYALNIAAAIAQIPGNQSTKMTEPDTIKQEPGKGRDLERIAGSASLGATIGILAGTAINTSRGFGIGALSGLAGGTLAAVLARGGDVQFESGTPIEIALKRAMAIDPEEVRRPPR